MVPLFFYSNENKTFVYQKNGISAGLWYVYYGI